MSVHTSIFFIIIILSLLLGSKRLLCDKLVIYSTQSHKLIVCALLHYDTIFDARNHVS